MFAVVRRCLLVLGLLVPFATAAAVGASADEPAPLALDRVHERPIGERVSWLAERGAPLALEQVQAARRDGLFSPGREAALTFGIGADPRWIHFRLRNPAGEPAVRRISVDTAWLDRLDFHVLHAGKTMAHARMGDRLPQRRRPVPGTGFAFEHAFAPGISDVFLRVETPDPMVVPIRVRTPEQAQIHGLWFDRGYAFLYGFLFALIAYNAMLFAGLRERRYLLYSVYLAGFLLANLSYTGHAYQWLWPGWPGWTQWSQPLLMMLFAATGLLFALEFLDVRRHYPRVQRAVLGYIGAGVALLVASFAAGWQAGALLLVFAFVSLFSAMMVVLGLISLRAGVQAARYFLAASVCAMAGTATTAMAVWGAIPYNGFTFHAVDIGMALDATLLALALTYQFRVARERRAEAEELARLDPLTGINNRRAFHGIATPIWNIAARNRRALSVIVLDIDRFKHINDTWGHATGDAVIRGIARVIEQAVREQDVIARWGGEEFLLLLPETEIEHAVALAERLREMIAAQCLACEGRAIAVTASLGVACRQAEHSRLEDVIALADHHLYEAKAGGRNRVVAPDDDDDPDPGGVPEPAPASP